MLEGSADRLDTEQEREQEQEQEKEVEARKEQQIEVEKFVEREYSRQEESQRPWPFYLLARPMETALKNREDFPFYPLKDFKLRHHEPLPFPDMMHLSTNYFNPAWTGLRRLKNVVMVMEYAPSVAADKLRLLTAEECLRELTAEQEQAVKKAYTLLGFHASAAGHQGRLNRLDVANAVYAATDERPSEEALDTIIAKFASSQSQGKAEGEREALMSFDEFRLMLTSGALRPVTKGRHWVALSLAEAETIRRVLHVRVNAKELVEGHSTALALRYSPMSGPEAPPAGDGGVVFDSWHKQTGSGAGSASGSGFAPTRHEASLVHACFRFFDCDMHFAPPAVNLLIHGLGGSTRDREKFFLSTVGCRRRMDRKVGLTYAICV
jgi:hypothetical protein